MGSNTYGWFLPLSTSKKTYDIENVLFRYHLSWRHWNFDGVCCCVTRRIDCFFYFILDFDNERAVQWCLHMLKPQHRLECEWLLRAGLIRKDLHLHNNSLSYVSFCFDYGEPWECKSTNRVLIVQEVIVLLFFFFWLICMKRSNYRPGDKSICLSFDEERYKMASGA